MANCVEGLRGRSCVFAFGCGEIPPFDRVVLGGAVGYTGVGFVEADVADGGLVACEEA